ncbi:hypothetical protein D9M73_160620 [compost metagenome]
MAVLPRVSGNAQYQACSEFPANTGTRVSSNTATTSWNSSTPMAFWPWLLKISPRPVNSLLTMAVEESARPAPSSKATLAGISRSRSKPASSTAEQMTCKLPSPNTVPRIASILGRENSRPRENSRKTTPISARSGSSSLSLTQSSAAGPTNRPTHK